MEPRKGSLRPADWEEFLGQRGFGHLYRSRYRDKKVMCAGEIERRGDGSWACLACAEIGHPFAGGAEKDSTHGVTRQVKIWALKYSWEGKGPFYVSTKTADWNRAQAFKRQKFVELSGGQMPWEKKAGITLDGLLDFVLAHYVRDRLRSIDKQERIKKQVLAFPAFRKGTIRAASVTSTMVNDDYVTWRLGQKKKNGKGYANATLNRELAMVREAFRMGAAREDEHGRALVIRVPRIKLLKESAPKEGLFEMPTLSAFLDAVRKGSKRTSPEDLADLFEAYSILGWRKESLVALEWTEVNWFRKVIVLRGEHSKNGDPWEIPFSTDAVLEKLLARRRRLTDELERTPGVRVPWVFHRRGKRIHDFRGAWDTALKTAGLAVTGSRKLTPHDFRRTVASDLINSGVDAVDAAKVTTHKTLSTFYRYRIQRSDDVAQALGKRAEHRKEREQALQLALSFEEAKKKRGG